MNLVKNISVALVLLLFASCEYSYDYTYSITNDSDTSILVGLKAFNTDTNYVISSGSSEKIYIAEHGIESRGGPFFSDVYHDLEAITVSKRDTISSRDYRANSTWIFTKDNGTYSATVTDDEFK